MTSDTSEQHQESIDTFAKSISKKLGYPVYVSFNIDLPPMDVKIVCAAVRKVIFEKFLVQSDAKKEEIMKEVEQNTEEMQERS